MRLYEITKTCGDQKNKYEQVLSELKPPVFWKDKPIIIHQLKMWSQQKLEEIIIKIAETEILMKKNSYLRNDIVIKNLIISLADKAATSS